MTDADTFWRETWGVDPEPEPTPEPAACSRCGATETHKGQCLTCGADRNTDTEEN